MIKAKATKEDGSSLLIFGLSKGNLKLLKQGRPIHIDLSEMGLPGEMLIFYGETELAMTKMMEPFLGPNTKFSPLSDKKNRQG
jgi:hypothetical protein